MEVQDGRRRRTTLSEQLSAAAAFELQSSAPKFSTSSSFPNLGDLLKLRQEEDLHDQQQQPERSRRSASISLGTFLACEKRELSFSGLEATAAAAAAADGIGGRTLLDIIRDEDEDEESRGGRRAYDGDVNGSGNSGHGISWKRAFKERLRNLRAGDNVDGVPAEGLIPPSPAASPPSRILVPEDNTVRSSTADATRPTEARQRQVQQVRVSLMALLDQTDRQGGGPGFAVSALLEGGVEEGDREEEEEDDDDDGGGGEGKRYYTKCCVCMVRRKGAAFIPCGHTFCRLCSRELWITRGNCPLCNGFILEVLDIF